eukprot:scaffold15836_cov138-Skeletonema_dohrnii-CCMP3373.AAC.2
MPWYEQSSSAPRYSASRNSADGEEWSNGHQTNDTRNDNEQIISLQDYLDVNWHNNDDDNENTTNGSNNYSAVQQRQSRITFDSFQHRVEHQLGAAVFPSVASSSFAALNSSLYQTHFNHNHHHHHDSSSHINGDDSRTATSFSKTAQFFHPRKVMALRQYEGFFSPLDSNFNNCCDGAADSSQQANQQQSDECSKNDDRLAVNDAASDKQQHNIQIQPRNLFVSSQTNNSSVNDHHHDNYYSAAAALPIIGNGNYNSSSFHNSSNYYNKRKEKLPFVQATLRQDPTTGQLATSLQHDHKERNNEGRSTTVSSSLLGGKATSWENYGGRPLMDGDHNEHGQSLLRESGKEHNEKTKAKKKKAKKKRKDKSKGKDGGEKNKQCIDSIFQRQMGADENDGNADDGDEGGNSKKKKSKKTKKKRSFIDASCELTIPTDQGDNSNILANPTLSTKSAQPTLSEQDFEGMTNTMNAAQCMEGLQQFLSRVGQEPYVAWTMIFLDPLCHYRQYASDSSSSTGNNNNNSKRRKKSKTFSLNSDTTTATMLECTTPFLPSNKRYCTDKGPTCTAWNCTCDDQIRAMRGGAPLLGAMFVLNKRDEEGGGEDGCGATAAAEGGRRGKECYLLPLGPTEKCLDDLEAGYSRMKSWPIIPFDCEVSLSDRWR